jgi:hypothetical protein
MADSHMTPQSFSVPLRTSIGFFATPSMRLYCRSHSLMSKRMKTKAAGEQRW